jgi:hypothetical protein
MLVKDLKKQLENYSDDEEVIVAYWDKECVDGYRGDEVSPITDTEWSEVVVKYEDGEFGWQSDAAEALVEIVDEVKNVAS